MRHVGKSASNPLTQNYSLFSYQSNNLASQDYGNVTFRQGNCDMLEELITNGGNVNVRGHQQMPPLHVAAWYGYDKAINTLVQAGQGIYN